MLLQKNLIRKTARRRFSEKDVFGSIVTLSKVKVNL